jgi:hypothetical protein
MPFDYSTHPAAMPQWERGLRVAAYRVMHPVRSWRARRLKVTWYPETNTYEVRYRGNLTMRGTFNESSGTFVWMSSGRAEPFQPKPLTKREARRLGRTALRTAATRYTWR